MKAILAKKIEMTQFFDTEGNMVPVTLVKAGPCTVLRLKTKGSDGYESIQLGFDKNNKGKFRYIKEFKDFEKETKTGEDITVSLFEEGEKVKVSGTSKGKGFQGGVKRWGFAGKSKSHGVRHVQRTIGSVGACTPSRVIKGRKMPGRTGRERVCVKNLVVMKVDKENNLLAIKGAVPGRRGTLLEIRA